MYTKLGILLYTNYISDWTSSFKFGIHFVYPILNYILDWTPSFKLGIHFVYRILQSGTQQINENIYRIIQFSNLKDFTIWYSNKSKILLSFVAPSSSPTLLRMQWLSPTFNRRVKQSNHNTNPTITPIVAEQSNHNTKH